MNRVRDHFLAQLAEQWTEAGRHLADPYWTDSRTGHNIGRDEAQAVAAMQSIALDDYENPSLAAYRARLLADLDAVAVRFRATAPDPDGYGIATIGTVARNLATLPLDD